MSDKKAYKRRTDPSASASASPVPGKLAQTGQDLRQRAEEIARKSNSSTTPVQNTVENAEASLPEDTRHLLHELRVHQIELEMQNDELRRIQIELEEARARYFDLYDLAPVGYVVLSEKGLILEANLATANLLGVARNTLVKKPMTRFILQQDQDIYYRHRKALFETGEPQTCELRLMRVGTEHRVGTPFWAQLDSTVAHDPDGATVCRAVLNDISIRKQAEDIVIDYTTRLKADVAERTHELRAAQEKILRQERLAVLGQLTGSIGHELRNPLGVIANAVYFLKLTQPDANETVKEYLNIIENETRASDKIVKDLLGFARVNSVNRELVTVSELTRQTLDHYPVPASVQVALDFPLDLQPVYADPQHVVHILGNLVTNACQAMEAVGPEHRVGTEHRGGKLTISAAIQGEMVRIAVQDTGVGIPPDNIGEIFEPLFTTKMKGIGLGLAVSKKLAEANGGRIELTSEVGEGSAERGSTFILYLPTCKDVNG